MCYSEVCKAESLGPEGPGPQLQSMGFKDSKGASETGAGVMETGEYGLFQVACFFLTVLL